MADNRALPAVWTEQDVLASKREEQRLPWEIWIYRTDGWKLVFILVVIRGCVDGVGGGEEEDCRLL